MPAVGVAEIDRILREEHGRAVAVLVRVLGDIDAAEDAVQDAFTAAGQRWPATGLPHTPAGWIITTARNRAIDRLCREASRHLYHAVRADLLRRSGRNAEAADAYDAAIARTENSPERRFLQHGFRNSAPRGGLPRPVRR